jgi:hypothetical protein
MQTVTPGSKLTLTAMFDEFGKVAGCFEKRDEDFGQAWACFFCMWKECPMKGKYLEVA